ncbi:SDR family NAD(P)-dependent oxidoreductase [Celeribacter indicus]|uniref:FabG n=1 Tax=Celeribacter indicus TaxID=1208324 RepID=A0A0B5DXE9_9RHOB|nr:SDR family oxidoreductase [Celeribacter indicus]AJE45770.1 FabG [Celeribacter indicus]SDX53060.1 acetoacetyl-CoA reductase/3-oxoacyl-[acyl-carrier protein] reductase [Celeribacter indicus]
MSPIFSLDGRRVLVIDASHGVGPAVADTVEAAGAAVLRRDLDGSEPDAWLDGIEEAEGPIDTLILAAPPVSNKPVLEMTAAEMRAIAEAEMVGPALVMQEAARRMAARGFGRIVVFASMSAKTGLHHHVAPHAAAKAGLLAFMRVLAAEIAGSGVTANGIATALFEPQTARMSEEKRSRLLREVPVGRFGRSVEAAHAVLFLLAPDAGYITGETLNMSGGRFMD